VPARAPLALNSLTNPAAYEDPEWLALHEDLSTYSVDPHVFMPNIYRKGWECTQTIYGLTRLGVLDPSHRAVGVGAGRDPVIFWLGDHLASVLATDLYGNDAWSTAGGREADPSVLDDAQHYTRRPIKPGSIEFKVMDGTALQLADESFDIAWSLSSIEHFGGHDSAATAVREMARVVRRGGIVAIATEQLLLDEYSHPEYFTRAEIEKYVIDASPDLDLVEPVDWSLPPTEYLIDSIILPAGAHRFRRHVVLNDGDVQWTSVLLFLQKR
jgi:SAM-dependent methyltransferase